MVWPGPNSHDGNGGHPCTRHSHLLTEATEARSPQI